MLLVRGIKAQIDDRKAKLDAKQTAAIKALDDLEAALSEVEGRDLPGEACRAARIR